MEIHGNRWKYLEINGNILKQLVLTIVNLKERSYLPIDKKSLCFFLQSMDNKIVMKGVCLFCVVPTALVWFAC
ncbi:hypothetical protein DMA11_00405 [Marinilabiliaceae bacterium JC017]|nr:hypothetical protein DMA11_00405 [Marinilabiliaceae bacterium JC017]